VHPPRLSKWHLKAQQKICKTNHRIQDLNIHQALVLPEEGYRTVQLILTGGDDTTSASFRVLSLAADQTTWILHATGRVESEVIAEKLVPFELEEIRARCPDQVSGEEYYRQLHELGLEFGSSFRGLTRIWRGEGEALGLVQLPGALTKDTSMYQMHPAFLDAAYLVGCAPGDIEVAYLLIGIDRLQFYRRPGTTLWNHTVVRQLNTGNDAAVTGDIRLFDETGALVAEIEGLHLIRAEQEALLRSVQELPGDWFYRVDWQSKPLPIRTVSGPSEAHRSKVVAVRPMQTDPELVSDRLKEYRRFDIDHQVRLYHRRAQKLV
jgi:acyl transferase domain-containing protein